MEVSNQNMLAAFYPLESLDNTHLAATLYTSFLASQRNKQLRYYGDNISVLPRLILTCQIALRLQNIMQYISTFGNLWKPPKQGKNLVG